jgi:hypothetical protein
MRRVAGTAGVLACSIPSAYRDSTQQARTPAVPATRRPILPRYY